MDRPAKITENMYRYDQFANEEVLFGKKKDRLPAMGWNSWNAFGSGNTEALTKEMADRLVELELDQLGYKYVVLDDGCYKPERVDGLLSNEEVKFPSGFRALADYIHAKGLKFGMYNDIGTNLCAGAAVGTCGHEKVDAKTYLDWDIDFIKVDNCYYLWDNATFSNAENARYTHAPRIKSITLTSGNTSIVKRAAEGTITGTMASLCQIEGSEDCYVQGIGTFDGTGPEHSPVGLLSSELIFEIPCDCPGDYTLAVEYAADKTPECGSWLQVAVGDAPNGEIYFDDLLPETESQDLYQMCAPITIKLSEGVNRIRLMNHRRQENTLHSYAMLLEGFMQCNPEKDVVLSICEWGKTQPHNWGAKVGDSWRILNDITFQVGSDGDPGVGNWNSDYTTGVAVQYNKAVIMDEYAGLDKGWNDPDMLMIGMNGLTEAMNKTHMVMWCMLNSPLMLGLDLRRVAKGDTLWQIISNRNLIALNQDALGIQAKRIATSMTCEDPSKDYLRDNQRLDVLAKPLADGSVAISFINLSDKDSYATMAVSKKLLLELIGHKMKQVEAFDEAGAYVVKNLWTGEEQKVSHLEEVGAGVVLAPCENLTLKVTPM